MYFDSLEEVTILIFLNLTQNGTTLDDRYFWSNFRNIIVYGVYA